MYDVAAHEDLLWTSLASSFGQKQLFEDQAKLSGNPLDPDESKRGWPWVHGTFAGMAEAHLTPWLRREADAKSTGGRLILSPAHSSSLEPAAHDEASGSGVVVAPPPALKPPPQWAALPLTFPMWPEPDVLSISRADREQLAEFAARSALPESIAAALAACGLGLAQLSVLPAEQVNALLARVVPPVSTGQRLRLKSAISCEFGVTFSEQLSPPPSKTKQQQGKKPVGNTATSKQAGAAQQQQAAATHPPLTADSLRRAPPRVFHLARPCLVAVTLSPSLPVRERPELSSPTCGARRCGEIAIAVAESRGWLLLKAAQAPTEHASGWALWDGRFAGQPGQLLTALRSVDRALLSARRAAWSPCVYPKVVEEHGRSDGEWSGQVLGTLARESTGGEQLVPANSGAGPADASSNTNNASCLSELVLLGGNIGALARLARQDRSALQAELKSIGVLKVGARLQAQQALLASHLHSMPSVADALQKKRDEKELEALLKLAGLPVSQVPSLLAAGVSVRIMVGSSLERVETSCVACPLFRRNDERLCLLEACHVHIHRRTSLLDDDVRRLLRGGEKETLAATLATAMATPEDEADNAASTGITTVARAVSGGAASVASSCNDPTMRQWRPPPRSCDTFVFVAGEGGPACTVFGKNADRPSDESHQVLYAPAATHSAGSMLKCTHIEIPQVSCVHRRTSGNPSCAAWTAGATSSTLGLAGGANARRRSKQTSLDVGLRDRCERARRCRRQRSCLFFAVR